MLILSRRLQEAFLIGDDIKVVVLGMKGTQVRIGIQASRDTAVHREEVYEEIRREEALVRQRAEKAKSTA